LGIRIHELAKELDLKSKELVEAAKSLGFDVKSHMSVLGKRQVTKLTEAVSGTTPVVKKKPKPKAKKAVKKGVKGPAAKPKAQKAVKKAAKKPVKKAVAKPKAEKAARKPAKKKTVPPEAVEKPTEAEPEVVVKEVPPEELPVSLRPLTIREKKKPRPGAKIIYRPGDEGTPSIKPKDKKKRPTPQPLARIRLEPEDGERQARIRREGRRDREDRSWVAGEDRVTEVRVRPRLPIRRRVKPIPVRQKPKIAPKPTQADLVSPVSIKDFSAALGIKASVIIGKLMGMGIMANINQTLDDNAVGLLAEELGVTVTLKQPKDAAEDLLAHRKIEDTPEDMRSRAPVVTFLGHVDHGKTSLLDAIRKANVVASESGGITQHIGAYKVTTAEGKSVVFLDTPGHEAFTEMRARGANVTDVAVLVVAADDGVMPQTEEAVNHAKEAGVPIVVALNKMDLPQANADRVRQQLNGLELVWDRWGGTTVMVECSAVTAQGLVELVEMLSLEAELLELKANPKRPAEGVVIEARSSEGRGVTATLLVRNGTLHIGDVVLCGRAYGRVRAMYDDTGTEVHEAGPATPVSVTGLSVVPEAGDRMYVVDDLAQAKEVADVRDRRMRQESLAPRRGIKLEEFFEYMSQAELSELRVILKADVKGSVEVLRKTVQDVATDEVRVRVLHAAVGGVNESDVLLAHASQAIIIGFHVAPEEKARLLAEDKGVDIRLYQVIYQVGDEVKKAVEGLLAPEKREVIDGHIEVRETFKVSRLGTVAGCYVTDGVVNRQSRLRVIREGVVIYDGRIATLRRFKDDVREVRAGFECGVKLGDYDDVKVGDQFETYHIEEIARKL